VSAESKRESEIGRLVAHLRESVNTTVSRRILDLMDKDGVSAAELDLVTSLHSVSVVAGETVLKMLELVEVGNTKGPNFMADWMWNHCKSISEFATDLSQLHAKLDDAWEGGRPCALMKSIE
jgi:hypothetical protein